MKIQTSGLSLCGFWILQRGPGLLGWWSSTPWRVPFLPQGSRAHPPTQAAATVLSFCLRNADT